MKTDQNIIEHIPLLRGGGIVSSLSGSLGLSLKETRLTAFLGYLIALSPEKFLSMFNFPGELKNVSLETVHTDGRSDILIETTRGRGVIEAKIDAGDPRKQSMKYPANWRILLTQYIPSKKEKTNNMRYVQWREIGHLLKQLSRSQNPKVKFVSTDLLSYLEEYHMIKPEESVEVYAREINEPSTLLLFLKARMYGCWYEKNSKLPQALYFAPHFGQSIANNYPGIHVGLSYVARIETVEVIETWDELLGVIRSVRNKSWLSKHKNILDQVHKKWDWNTDKKRCFLFLGEPRLVFNPPITKDRIQKGYGWLSKRFMSFDDLFAAWEGNLIKN
jgi:hypothetical protein